MLKMDTYVVDGAPMKIFLIIQVRGSQGYTLIGSRSDEPNKKISLLFSAFPDLIQVNFIQVPLGFSW